MTLRRRSIIHGICMIICMTFCLLILGNSISIFDDDVDATRDDDRKSGIYQPGSVYFDEKGPSQMENTVRLKRWTLEIGSPSLRFVKSQTVKGNRNLIRKTLENHVIDANKDKLKLSKTMTQELLHDESNRRTELSDIFISVKTTQKYHRERLDVILDTWFTIAKYQTYFFTDADDKEYQQKTSGHMINTNCSQGHNRRDLCCKMSIEYDTYIKSNKRWFCHVDDDSYVNVPRLVQTLRKFSHTQQYYLGKPSLNYPLEVMDKDIPGQKLAFWFATGGAGFCLSRALALAMLPYAGEGKLQNVCEKIRLPDDCSIGYVINYLLKTELTVVKDFHSHLESLSLLNHQKLQQYITMSYAPYGMKHNVIDIPGLSTDEDPTRFRSIHCKLFPNYEYCRS